MDTLTNEELTYHYYSVVRDESPAVQDLDNRVLYVTCDNENDQVIDDANTSYELESLEAVNNLGLEVANNNVEYVDLDNGAGFLKNSVIEDEHYEAIKPSLISLNHNDSNQDQYIQNMGVEPNLQLHLDNLNTSYDILHSENSTSEFDLEGSTGGFRCISEGCEKIYATSYHLSAHMITHVNRRPFVCPIEGCSKKLSSNFAMKNHLKIHTGERPFMCDHCSKGFKTSGELGKHARIHTGIKPFPCTIEGCDRSFTTSNIRKIHIRSHTGERPYLCKHPGCGKAFTSSANQKSHQRIHSREKPYACTVQGCGKRFTEYSTMHRHMLSHQNQTSLPLVLEDLLLNTSEDDELIFENL